MILSHVNTLDVMYMKAHTYSKTGHAMYCHIQYVFHMIEDDRQGQRTNDGGNALYTRSHTYVEREGLLQSGRPVLSRTL